MESNQIVRQAWLILEPQVVELGYELVEVEFGDGAGGQALRLFIDKPETGITLEDCTKVSRVVSPILDMDDFIPDEYMLEVSSPGVDRPLRKPSDFTRFIGEPIQLEANAAIGGRRRFKGRLSGFSEGMIEIEIDDELFSVHIENLKKANINR